MRSLYKVSKRVKPLISARVVWRLMVWLMSGWHEYYLCLRKKRKDKDGEDILEDI